MIHFFCHAAEVGGHAVLLKHAILMQDPLGWFGYSLLLAAALLEWLKPKKSVPSDATKEQNRAGEFKASE